MYRLFVRHIPSLFVIFIVATISLACGTASPSGLPSDYFPTATETKWVYKIEIGEVRPLNYREVTWLWGEGQGATYAQRGSFLPLLKDDKNKTFVLEITVLKTTNEEGPLKWPNGVELKVVKDELGVFEGAEQVFWATSARGASKFRAMEVVAYSPNSPGAPTVAESGYSVRDVFFGEAPGTTIGLSAKPIDTLLFVGSEDQVPQYQGNPCPCLHFRRTVKPDEKQAGDEQSYLDKGFAEDMWFAKGKGLVRLEQEINGVTSMVWTLK